MLIVEVNMKLDLRIEVSLKIIKATRDDQRNGIYPHVSIMDKVFVETIGGDLTIKVEDNTETGKGVYSEPVDDADQNLDDAEIYYVNTRTTYNFKNQTI